ncbi:MAG: hypothetical protein QNL88_07230 [Acidobacteriota bacterium]|nr:hypothetical protein [Acidobacteriota bacterium]
MIDPVGMIGEWLHILAANSIQSGVVFLVIWIVLRLAPLGESALNGGFTQTL